MIIIVAPIRPSISAVEKDGQWEVKSVFEGEALEDKSVYKQIQRSGGDQAEVIQELEEVRTCG